VQRFAMISSKQRNAPSAYPFPVTYLMQGTSVVFTAAVTGMASYFIYYLNMDDMAVPYEFIVVSHIAAESCSH
jgi:hypothetical protein